MNQEKVGKFIAKCRKEKNITQVQLATMLGVSDRAVSKWETGKSMPDLSLLIPLSEILGISVNDLLNGEFTDKGEYQKSFENNVIEIISKVDNKKKLNIFLSYFFVIVSLLIAFSSFFYTIYTGFEMKQDYNKDSMLIQELTDGNINFKASQSGTLYSMVTQISGENIIFINYESSLRDILENKYKNIYNNFKYNHGINMEDLTSDKFKIYYTNVSFEKIENATKVELQKILEESYLIYESNN